MLLQAALNGARTPDEHPALPVTPAELARDAAAAVAAGARSVHVHPRAADGTESLAPEIVAGALAALRATVPGIEVSLSTGLWIAGGDPDRRRALIEGWTALPELVSLNVREPGWEALGAALRDIGIGIEIGLATPEDAEAFAASPLASGIARVLVEIDDETLAGSAAVAVAEAIDGVLDEGRVSAPRLHHGRGRATWAVLDAAAAARRDLRIGLEDTLVDPDGAPAPSNAALVAVAAARYLPAGPAAA
jgi:uncharacterized protein (DUF849 family)